MNKPVVVIGHRMGKGQKIAAGVEKAGGTAILIPGMLADMKIGDVMKQQNADLGLSFCGSGGAGALNAKNKYGYKAVQQCKTLVDFANAVKQGYQVIGGPFADNEQIGETVVKTWKQINEK